MSLAPSVARLVQQSDRLRALRELKCAGIDNLAQRQRIVNDLQRQFRERGTIDTDALAEALAALRVRSIEPSQTSDDGSSSETAGRPARGSAATIAEHASTQPAVLEPHPRKIHIFGDSHTHVFAAVECSAHAILAYPFVAGSAMGLNHSNSRSGYRGVLERDLLSVGPTEVVAFKFGQVDIDFVYYLKLVDTPALSFDAFAADSVVKYLNFVENVLHRFPFGRDRFFLITPNPTVVTDPYLRESLCTLPFMRAEFKTEFRAKLDKMELPDMLTRTSYGQRYCELLQSKAGHLGLKTVDMYNCLLGLDGVALMPNVDAQHHLIARHVPLLLSVLDRAFGGKHSQSESQQPAVLHSQISKSLLTGGLSASDVKWLQIYSEVTTGRRNLKLRGHVQGSYENIARKCGQPMRQSCTPEGPLFASWLVRFFGEVGGPAPAAMTAMGLVVHIKGRFMKPSKICVWEVEAEDDGSFAVGAARSLASGENVEVEAMPSGIKTLQALQHASPALLSDLSRVPR